MKTLKQRTLKKKISAEGIGLFSGVDVSINLIPAEENTGIIFKRVDLPNKPILKANLENVIETDRRTLVGTGKESIQTVEHLLSALRGYGIDNLVIEVKGPEIPAGDGSANLFVDLIEKAQIEMQNANKKIYRLKNLVNYSDKHIHLIAIPSDEYRISYTIHYPNSSFIKSQYFSYLVNEKTYKTDIAPSRTYSIYEEIKPLLDKKLIKGGDLNNAVVIKDNKVMNPDGIRFRDEMVRHKVLDLIGDMSLVGVPFLAHIIAIRSGHFYNISFAKKFKKSLILENS